MLTWFAKKFYKIGPYIHMVFKELFALKFSLTDFTKIILRQPGAEILLIFFDTDPRDQYNKTFYGRNLQIFAISYSIRPWQAFPV